MTKKKLEKTIVELDPVSRGRSSLADGNVAAQMTEYQQADRTRVEFLRPSRVRAPLATGTGDRQEPTPLESLPAALTPGLVFERPLAGLLLSPDRRHAYPLFEGRNLFGRNTANVTNDIHLDDPAVSPEQGTIVCRSSRVLLRSHGRERHATRVNGREVDDLQHELGSGDTLEIGELQFRLILFG